MVLNKKGQSVFLAFMLAVTIIILALAFTPAVNQMATLAMNETSEIGGMNCTATTNDFVKAGCWTIDIAQGAFIGMLIALAGIIVAGRLIWQ